MQPLIARRAQERLIPAAAAHGHAHAVRRDPAPSRVAYRMQRLWLTPLFRALMRVGLPGFVIAMSAGLYLSDADRRAALTDHVVAVKKSVEERPEFMVTLLSVEGASPPLAAAIRGLADVQFPVSSFALDLEAMRQKIERIDAVDHAELHVRAGGILAINVTERQPALVWRDGAGLTLLDAGGHRVAGLTVREGRPDLDLIAGEGADRAVPEALALFRAAGPIADRVRGLVRMGERRWDLVLDNDMRILLPETDPVPALERVIALDGAEQLLSRAVTVVDMRNRQRPTLRLTPEALARMRGQETSMLAKATQ